MQELKSERAADTSLMLDLIAWVFFSFSTGSWRFRMSAAREPACGDLSNREILCLLTKSSFDTIGQSLSEVSVLQVGAGVEVGVGGMAGDVSLKGVPAT